MAAYPDEERQGWFCEAGCRSQRSGRDLGADRELQPPMKSVEADAQGDRLLCLLGVKCQEAQGD